MLVEDGRVLFEIPLSAQGWDREDLRREFDGLERDMERFSRLFKALANAGRVRMMSALLKDLNRPLTFTDIMQELQMNPKVVWDSTRRLRRTGLIEKDDDGRYRPTDRGEAQFLMVGVALRRLLQILE